MRCKGVQKRITAFHDGVLPPPEAGEVAQHLASCAECASELEALKKTIALLGSWEVTAGTRCPSASEVAGRALAGPASVARPDRRFSLRLWVVAGLAGAILGFITGVFLEGRAIRPAAKTPEPALADLHPLPIDLSLFEAIGPKEER